MIQTTNNSSPAPSKAALKYQRALWCARIVFGLVFIINVQCALQFIFTPDVYVGAYELNGIAGTIALQGMGIAFLMWNTTYPFYIARPIKWRVVGVIILAQQAIGLIGESLLLTCLPSGHEILTTSIQRFILFDGIGLLAMTAAFLFLLKKL